MDKKKEIYLVSSGCYSDYRIDAVFSTEELAQKYIDNIGVDVHYGEMGIEVYNLNPCEAQIKEGLIPFSVKMDVDGNADYPYYKQTYKIDYVGFKVGVKFDSYDSGKVVMISNCFAEDEEQAIKIANERRVQYIASNTWGKNL